MGVLGMTKKASVILSGARNLISYYSNPTLNISLSTPVTVTV